MTYLAEICEVMPGNFQMFNKELRSLIDFKLLQIDTIVQFWIDDFSLSEHVFGLKDKFAEISVSTKINMAMLFVAALLFFVAMSLICSMNPMLRDRTIKLFLYVKELMIWNGIFRTYLISYMLLLATFTKSAGIFFNSKKNTDSALVTMIILLTLLAVPPVLISLWLRKNKLELHKRHNLDRFGNLYENLTFLTSQRGLLFYPVFMAKRLMMFVTKGLTFTSSWVSLCFFAELIFIPNALFYSETDPHFL